MRTRKPRRRVMAVLGMLLVGLFAVQLAVVAVPAAHAATRAGIASVANGEVGASEANGQCAKYGPCHDFDWCAMFVSWVWRTAGVSPYPTTWVATEVGAWGQARGLWKPRPAG